MKKSTPVLKWLILENRSPDSRMTFGEIRQVAHEIHSIR